DITKQNCSGSLDSFLLHFHLFDRDSYIVQKSFGAFDRTGFRRWLNRGRDSQRAGKTRGFQSIPLSDDNFFPQFPAAAALVQNLNLKFAVASQLQTDVDAIRKDKIKVGPFLYRLESAGDVIHSSLQGALPPDRF